MAITSRSSDRAAEYKRTGNARLTFEALIRKINERQKKLGRNYAPISVVKLRELMSEVNQEDYSLEYGRRLQPPPYPWDHNTHPKS